MYVVQDGVKDRLFVLTTVFNSQRFKSRWKLYQRFAKMVIESGAILYTIEVSFGERDAAVDHCAPNGPADPELAKCFEGDQHKYIRVQSRDELWLKENAGNLLLHHLPADAKYIAWMDSDLLPARPNWVGEAIHTLQHYAVAQMWSQTIDLSPSFEIVKQHRSFADCYLAGMTMPVNAYYSGSGGIDGGINTWHPGFGWLFRREALDALGGFIDFGILGSADRHMATALIGRVLDSAPEGIHPTYRDALLEWQDRAERYIRRNIGCMKGALLHYWHGRKSDRAYKTRWQILVDREFDVLRDIKKNSFGLWQFCDHGDERSILLRDDVRAYFAARNEDTIEVR
jgi:hypothetical protein